MSSFWLGSYEIFSFIVLFIGILLFLRFFVANPFKVLGASMYPTLQENNIIVVDKISPRFGFFGRWDVIVFTASGKDVPYVKRIVGLPWEIVKIKWGKVLICEVNDNNDDICRVLDEDYLPSDITTIARCNVAEFYVKSWFFVLWDNRWLSTDSLCCFGNGCEDGASFTVSLESIDWKVWMRLFPNIRFF